MAKVTIVTGEALERLEKLRRKSITVFEMQLMKYLTAGSALIQEKSTNIAKREAKGVTGNYMGGFVIDQIKRDEKGELFVKISNLMPYSMLLETGGVWKKQPPPMVLDEWIKKAFSPKTEAEATSIAIAIGKMFVRRSRSGKGQRLLRSGAKRKGALLTMTRALKDSIGNLQWLSSYYVEEGLKML